MRITTIGVTLRRGVSLVELLTAMTITAVLAGFLIGGAQKVIVLAANLQIAWEISQLNEAVEDFAVQFGDYPPDFHDQAKVVLFLQHHFPKCPPENYPSFAGQSPASALYFWLAGPKGKGFSADPANPFGDGPRRIGPFIRFADDRLKKKDGVVQYLPPQNKGGSPYVYFRAGEKGYTGNSGWPPARPYRDSRDGSWINADSFQILCAGHDGVYGAGNHFPGGADYDQFNLDDMSNFSRRHDEAGYAVRRAATNGGTTGGEIAGRQTAIPLIRRHR